MAKRCNSVEHRRPVSPTKYGGETQINISADTQKAIERHKKIAAHKHGGKPKNL